MALEPIGASIDTILAKIGASSQTCDNFAQHSIDFANSRPGKPDGPEGFEDCRYDCPICLNRGYIFSLDERGYEYTRECECMAIRRNLRRVKRSGLSDLLERYTFDSWKTPEPWQKKAMEMAKAYAQGKKGWLVAYGQSGSGKTHLCSAICGELLHSGVDTLYIRWRDFSTKAKGLAGHEEERCKLVDPTKKVRCLYIDDFLKCGDMTPTTADINLAFEIVSERYDDSRMMTIISTEYTMDQLPDIDEAMAYRILERSQGYTMSFIGKKNWRKEGQHAKS